MRTLGYAAALICALLISDAVAQSDAATSTQDVARTHLAEARTALSANANGATNAMFAALREARRAGGMDAEVHVNSVAFGTWLLRQQDYDDAMRAWEVAVDAAGAAREPNFARGRSRTGQGAAILLNELQRSGAPWPRVLSSAHDAIDDALILLKPYADQPGPGEAWTQAQISFAEALAWHHALGVTALSNGQRRLGGGTDAAHNLSYEVGAGSNAAPLCEIRTVERPNFSYPNRAVAQGQVGAVVLGLRTDDSGAIVRTDVVVTVGASDLAQAASAAHGQWRFEWQETTPNCRKRMNWLTVIRFTADDPY